MASLPGYKWRLLAHNEADADAHQRVALSSEDYPGQPVQFDELVIDDWFHLEQMAVRSWWMRVGDVDINVQIDRSGKATVTVEEDT